MVEVTDPHCKDEHAQDDVKDIDPDVDESTDAPAGDGKLLNINYCNRIPKFKKIILFDSPFNFNNEPANF